MNAASDRIWRVFLAAVISICLVQPVAAESLGSAAASIAPAESSSGTKTRPCRWWHFGNCAVTPVVEDIEGLPDGAPRTGTIITVDLSTNTLYLFKDGVVVEKTPVASGSGKTMRIGNDMWIFETPQGRMNVKSKIVDPVWRKPDWAFVEEGRKIPSGDHPSRYVKGKLGKYALSLGDGILIHGTDDPSSIGKRVSHGCIRVGAKPLARIFKAAQVGTEVYVFESREPQLTASGREARFAENAGN